MTRIESILTLIGTAGAALASIGYISRKAKHVLEKVDDYVSLPKEFADLRSVVARNTLAIDDLKKAVNHLADVEQERAS